jgi:hypothetical protein
VPRRVNSLLRILVVASIAVLGLDTLGSLASKAFGFPFSSLAWGSLIIYAAAGFFAARGGGLRTAALGGGGVALVDTTLGWAISWALGPGRPAAGYTGMGPIVGTVTLAWLTGIASGLLGGVIAHFLPRRRDGPG